ncbi:MAG: PqqD family protein [Acidobacteria bacterium]|jgi:hypothetical protein|nr:PqqD family protein [Acidobacteriota bacterium]
MNQSPTSKKEERESNMSRETAPGMETEPVPVAAHDPGFAVLSQFPQRLQGVIIDEIMKCKAAKATDIWFEDKTSGIVSVMRNNMQWQFNETASKLWIQLGDKTTAHIIEQLSRDFSVENTEQIKAYVVEFMLQASINGLINLYPETTLRK